jgi:hypothetical protein
VAKEGDADYRGADFDLTVSSSGGPITMLYNVILESVRPGFRNPTIAAVVTLTETARLEHGDGFIIRSAVGLDLRGCAQLVDSAPVVILRGVSLAEAREAKEHLESGYFSAGKDWPRPAPGEVCCVVAIRESA